MMDGGYHKPMPMKQKKMPKKSPKKAPKKSPRRAPMDGY